MGKILLPLILLVAGAGGGVGAGLFLVPPEETPAPEDSAAAPAAHDCPAPDLDPDGLDDIAVTAPGTTGPVEGRDYVRLNNQFVVPVVAEGKVGALVVLSLSLEVDLGQNELVFAQEPKLRDAFLQVLFDHANSGGFDGTFTSTANMRSLRTGLRQTARRIVGDTVHDVLIVEIVRQDV